MRALHKNSFLTAVVLLILGVGAVVVWRATADTVLLAGYDVFDTPSDSQTQEDLDLEAIWPGSGVQRVTYKGGSAVPGFGGDTVVTRISNVTVPGDTPLELHGLRLESVNTVQINGNNYTVHVEESSVEPSIGSMNFYEDGTFASNLNINRKYTFTSPGLPDLSIDSAEKGWAPIPLTATGNWSGSGRRVIIRPRLHTAPSHSHFVKPTPTPTPTPTVTVTVTKAPIETRN